MTDINQRQQVDTNYNAFVSVLPSILPIHRNKYALMRDGKIVNYYSTMQDAYITGNQFYDDGLYSIQKVTDIPVDLGFFSHVAGACRV